MNKYLLNKIYVIFNLFRLYYFRLRYKTYRFRYNIDPTFKFNGVDIEFYGEGKIIIGKNSYIGNRSVLASSKNQEINIGDNCSISHNVRIYTINRNPNDIISENSIISLLTGNVKIGKNCWIGANVFINQGVEIGDNVVVGANSVVTKSFESNVIVGGVPARILKKYNK